MPEEIAIIAIVGIISGTLLIMFLIWAIMQAVKSRTSKSSSLTTGELDKILRSAVADAVAPLAARVADLEESRTAPSLKAASEQNQAALLEPPEEP